MNIHTFGKQLEAAYFRAITRIPSSKDVEIVLRGELLIGAFRTVIAAFNEHVIDEADGQKVQIPDADAKLNTPEQKQRRRHFPVSRAEFFLLSASDFTFSPQRSMISGST